MGLSPELKASLTVQPLYEAQPSARRLSFKQRAILWAADTAYAVSSFLGIAAMAPKASAQELIPTTPTSADQGENDGRKITVTDENGVTTTYIPGLSDGNKLIPVPEAIVAGIKTSASAEPAADASAGGDNPDLGTKLETVVKSIIPIDYDETDPNKLHYVRIINGGPVAWFDGDPNQEYLVDAYDPVTYDYLKNPDGSQKMQNVTRKQFFKALGDAFNTPGLVFEVVDDPSKIQSKWGYSKGISGPDARIHVAKWDLLKGTAEYPDALVYRIWFDPNQRLPTNGIDLFQYALVGNLDDAGRQFKDVPQGSLIDFQPGNVPTQFARLEAPFDVSKQQAVLLPYREIQITASDQSPTSS